MTTNTLSSIRNLVLAVVASASVLSFAAAPAEAAEVRQARVDVGGFELSSAEGRKAVEQRVRAAAERLCAEGGLELKDVTEVAAWKLCVANAVVDGRMQMAEIASRTQLAAAQ